jgi:hypothetical protein
VVHNNRESQRSVPTGVSQGDFPKSSTLLPIGPWRNFAAGQQIDRFREGIGNQAKASLAESGS